MGEVMKGEKRLWEEDMWNDFSFSLLLSEIGRLLMEKESSLRIEAVVPKKAPHPPPPCWIVCRWFASLFYHQQTLCSRRPGRPAPLPKTPPEANHIFFSFLNKISRRMKQVCPNSVLAQRGQRGTMLIDIGPKERQK